MTERIEKEKRKPANHVIEFYTALPIQTCVERLERAYMPANKGFGGQLAPMKQRSLVQRNGKFTLERHFPAALHPIRLAGRLDHVRDDNGTWVRGAITHDTYNQVLIEGMIVFLTFFLLTVLIFLRLKVRGLVITLPMLIVMLTILSVRWRALRYQTEDMVRWVRRRLYVTDDQLRQNR